MPQGSTCIPERTVETGGTVPRIDHPRQIL